MIGGRERLSGVLDHIPTENAAIIAQVSRGRFGHKRTARTSRVHTYKPQLQAFRPSSDQQPKMTILLTGGTGNTALRIGLRLQKAQIPFMFASRKGRPVCPPPGLKEASFVEFDYTSPATYANPFEQASTKCDKISAIYLVAPQIPDPVPPMNAFIDFAVEKHNVARFVLLAAQGIEKNGMAQGKVWQHLEDLEDIGVEHAALGPTWFMGQSSATILCHTHDQVLTVAITRQFCRSTTRQRARHQEREKDLQRNWEWQGALG